MHWYWVVVFAGVYLIGSGEASLPNLGLALLVGIGACRVFLASLPQASKFTAKQLGQLPRFTAGVAIELLRGSVSMLWVLVGRRTWKNHGYIELPIGSRHPRGVLVLAWVATATPGSMLVEVQHERDVLLFHVIDAKNPEAARQTLLQFYEDYLHHWVP